MSPIEIKVALMRAGHKQSDIARQYGCSPVMVHLVITGKGTSRKLQKFIAKKMGLPPEYVFKFRSRRTAA